MSSRIRRDFRMSIRTSVHSYLRPYVYPLIRMYIRRSICPYVRPSAHAPSREAWRPTMGSESLIWSQKGPKEPRRGSEGLGGVIHFLLLVPLLFFPRYQTGHHHYWTRTVKYYKVSWRLESYHQNILRDVLSFFLSY